MPFCLTENNKVVINSVNLCPQHIVKTLCPETGIFIQFIKNEIPLLGNTTRWQSFRVRQIMKYVSCIINVTTDHNLILVTFVYLVDKTITEMLTNNDPVNHIKTMYLLSRLPESIVTETLCTLIQDLSEGLVIKF